MALTCSTSVAALKLICEFVIRNTFRRLQPSCSFSMCKTPCDAATVLTFDRSNKLKFGQWVCYNKEKFHLRNIEFKMKFHSDCD